jgi:two-component system nitrogen regulation sensor histidine kinase NtrY
VNPAPHRWWLPPAALTVIAAGEWLRTPTPWWVPVACLGAALGLWALRPWSGWRPRIVGFALILLALVPLVTEWRLAQLETHWPAIRQARVDRATERLAGDLHAAYLLANRLADDASAAPSNLQAAFPALEHAVAHADLEAGVALLDEAGQVRAWAGSHRLAPAGDGRPVSTTNNPFYLVLEVTREAPLERRAVGSVVVWASSAVPERVQSVTEDFRARTGVGLRVYPVGTAPDTPDVFDYSEPTTAGPRLLFSVQPVPPLLEEATAVAREAGARVTACVLLLTLILIVVVSRTAVARYAVLALGVAVLGRAPIGALLGLDLFFSPMSFFRPALGPMGSSAGALAILALLGTLLAVALWNRPPRGRWFSLPLGILLLLVAPVVLRYFSRGITPPAAGVSLGLWLGWQLTLALAAMAPAVIAAALLRGAPVRGNSPTAVWFGMGLTVVAAAAGLYVWQPGTGWDGWYIFLWLPGLLLVTRPAARTVTIIGIATVAGSAAALLTWGAITDSRLEAAQQDAMRLGPDVDPVVVPLLHRAGARLREAPAPRNASQLYVRWLEARTDLAGYPVRLALRRPDGAVSASLALDSLDLPEDSVAALATGLPPGDSMRISTVRGVPGVYQVLTLRLATEDLLTVAVGPQTNLLVQDRLGSLLDPSALAEPSYRMTLSPPTPGLTPDARRLRWRREGWSVHGERAVQLPDGVRGAHADVDLRGPFPLLVRGALVVVLDAVVLALIWLLAEAIAGMPPALPSWQRLRRSFRVRVAIALSGFFLVPAIGFSVWELSRLNTEAARQRDDAITQVLRDVVAVSTDPSAAPALPGAVLERLAGRFHSDLAVYRGGARIAATDSVLADLAILAPLQDASAFQVMAFDGEVESAADEPLLGRGGRVGYRVERPGRGDQLVVLAAPRGAEVTRLAASQADLGWLLLLATVLGLTAAVAAARGVAEALARPVADLRRAALALGRGEPPPTSSAPPPLEFEPVVAAFARMTQDIRQSRTALEESRRTTAAVLATVSTGVVGIGPDGAVMVANPRAEELLGGPLGLGVSFNDALRGEWPSLVAAVDAFLAQPESAPTEAELEDGTRRLAVALAPLGPEIGGAVLAVNDVTELSRAERVLAWGEMARQVAHEIKNPLTPIRLGIQHLRRVHRDRPGALGAALDETSERILSEIERLDTIARAFSRFAAPSGPTVPPDQVRLAPVANEVVHLYRLAGEGTEVLLESDPAAWGRAHPDEVKEILVNLLENARQAGAHHIVVKVLPQRLEVHDDGRGISEALLPRIFEPRFSTTTSGSGLGLAIVKRLVEGWGGTVQVESEEGRGTVVTVDLA